MANSKLNLMSSITRHDLINNLTAMQGYVQLCRLDRSPEKIAPYLDSMERLTAAAGALLAFTKDYQDLGMAPPTWQSINGVMSKVMAQLDIQAVRFTSSALGVKVLADPMLEKVFYNIMENSLRHGGGVTMIEVSCVRLDKALLLVFVDDGTGVPNGNKERIFERGFGKNSGLGLFLSREILAITGMSISERGKEGQGVRFEIEVPDSGYRIDDGVAAQ